MDIYIYRSILGRERKEKYITLLINNVNIPLSFFFLSFFFSFFALLRNLQSAHHLRVPELLSIQ